MEIVRYGQEMTTNLPVSGGGSALVQGCLLKRGATPASMNGHLRVATGSAAHPDTIGILKEAHATADDTDVAGTIFKTHPIELVTPFRIVRMAYAVASADLIACTGAVNSTTFAVTSLEDNIDAAFIYVVSGAGAGQINYLTASAGGSATLKAAFGTNLDTTSRFIKILPRFHPLGALNADGTKLTSQDAAGSWPIIVIDTWIVRGEGKDQLNPVNHSALTSLNNTVIRFEADVAIRDTVPYSID